MKENSKKQSGTVEFQNVDSLLQEAMSLIDKAIEVKTDEERKEYMRRGLELLDAHLQKLNVQLDLVRRTMEQEDWSAFEEKYGGILDIMKKRRLVILRKCMLT